MSNRDRGVSTTVSYVLALTITTLLISGLLTAGGTYVEQEREDVGREELVVVGERVAAGIQDVDRLAGASEGTSVVYVRVMLPEEAAGSVYSINVTQVSNQTNQPYAYNLHLRSDSLDIRETVPVRTHHEMATNTVTGDDVVIAYRDYDNDSTKEIVVQKEMNIPRPIGPHLIPHTQVVYGNNTYLHTTGEGDPVKTYDGTPAIIGPIKADLDGDGAGEIPYVNDTGSLNLIDENNETQVLVDNGAMEDNSRMTVGRWKGSRLSVFYVREGTNKVFRIAPGMSGPVEMWDLDESGGYGAQAVAGFGDIDGDGKKEFVYADDSQQLRYVDDDGDIEIKINNGGAGMNYGPGIGDPHDFNGDGEARVPFVDGSNNLRLTDSGGNVVTVVSGGVAKAPIATVDIDEDGQYEVVYMDTNGVLHYVDNLDDVGPSDGDPAVIKVLTTASGNTVHLNSSEREPGVA